jgi:REP element-mobilizing transposase RayT
LYEIIPRAREGLPLPPNKVTNQLLTGILARTQRDEKVTLCNFVDMNNHVHQHCIPNEPEQHMKFYMEYQKKVTDTVRRLTKRSRLNLWERRPSVAKLELLEDAIKRLVYIFLNPAKAGLESSIDLYPGLTTWKAFTTCEPSVDAEVRLKAYWTPVSRLESLPPGNRLSPACDSAMATRLRESKHTVPYELVVKPLAWLKVYGVTKPSQIEKVRQRIISEVYAGEAKLAKARLEQGRGVIGAQRLQHQEYLQPHTPKKKERNIFLICGDNTLRPILIQAFQDIFAACRKCYLALKAGLPHEWPPGTFIPWVPPRVCREAPF